MGFGWLQDMRGGCVENKDQALPFPASISAEPFVSTTNPHRAPLMAWHHLGRGNTTVPRASSFSLARSVLLTLNHDPDRPLL